METDAWRKTQRRISDRREMDRWWVSETDLKGDRQEIRGRWLGDR